jgi:type IV pilus assembly protein PilA
MTQISLTRSTHRNRQRGFTLMELLIVMSIMIILMLIAIPNFISMKAQADETSAIQSLRAIYQAQIQYQTNFPSNGFACALTALGGSTSSGPPSPTAAQVLQGDLATGQKSGYTFNIVNCNKVTVNNQDMYTSYEATAVPQSVGKSGHRGFCIVLIALSPFSKRPGTAAGAFVVSASGDVRRYRAAPGATRG